jgi:hypothetical protein
MMLRSRPATADDIRHFYPGVSCSFRAMVCEMDGERAGIIGIALARPVASVFTAFSEALRPYLRSLTVLRLLRWLKGLLGACKGPVFAIRERGERQAVTILKRLGFRFWGLVDGDAVYRFEGAR